MGLGPGLWLRFSISQVQTLCVPDVSMYVLTSEISRGNCALVTFEIVQRCLAWSLELQE